MIKNLVLESLKDKLKAIAQPKLNETLQIELTSDELVLYDSSTNDIYSIDEIIIESEGDHGE